jgi:hypothetical protein
MYWTILVHSYMRTNATYNFHRNPHTNIGDSEHPGGMKSYCTASAHTSSAQGTLPGNFWQSGKVALKSGTSHGRFIQCELLQSFFFLQMRDFGPGFQAD